MKKLRAVLLLSLALIIFCAGWLWWNRPQTVDMADYAPADAMLYLEANDLPRIAETITGNDVWREIAPSIDTEITASRVRWLSRIARWTGIGTAESVVLSRSQVAVVALGVDASATEEQAIKIKPRIAAIFETHTGASRTNGGMESLLNRLASNLYGTPNVSRRTTDEVKWTTWTPVAISVAANEQTRSIVLATIGGTAIVGNDAAAVETCLAVRRGERASLMNDAELVAMRARVDAPTSLAFGYVSASNSNKIFGIFAPLYAAQFSNTKLQSAAATLLPQLAGKFLGGAAWTMRSAQGEIADDYFFKLPNELTARLTNTLTVAPDSTWMASAFLPADTAQATRYALREPAVAWRGLNQTLSSQLDMLIAPIAVTLLEKSLVPYGIASPRDFLAAVGNEIWTARLDAEGERTVLVARVRDRAKLEREVKKYLGANARPETVGAATLLISNTASDTDDEADAASFIGDYLLMGRAEDLRLCLEAASGGRTLAENPDLKEAAATNADTSLVVTLTDNRETDRAVLRTLINLQSKSSTNAAAHQKLIEAVLSKHGYATTRTQLAPDGIERRTQSAFGQLGRLIASLSQ